jgi:hypothetical protein
MFQQAHCHAINVVKSIHPDFFLRENIIHCCERKQGAIETIQNITAAAVKKTANFPFA